MKKIILYLLTILFLSNLVYAQKRQNNDAWFANFQYLSTQQLFDTAKFFLINNNIDTALMCYNLIINTPVKNDNLEQQIIIVKALNNSATAYTNRCDYLIAYKYLIDALLLSEKYNIELFQPIIYNNLGNIYAHFCKYDMAKNYYQKSIALCEDTLALDLVYNNLGFIETSNGNIDSAFYFLGKSLQICKENEEKCLNITLNSMGSLFQKTKQYDSAYYYFQQSLEKSRNNNDIQEEVNGLSNLGNLFFEIGKPDSALFYINLSNSVATKNNFLQNLSDNYLIIATIEKSRGNIKSAFENLNKYVYLKDSVVSTEIFGDINQLQRLYEISKTDRQIEQLYVEQQIKENTIHYQKIIVFIILSVLSLMTGVLVFIYFQNRRLKRAYKILFEKHIEIIEFNETSPEKKVDKCKNLAINDEKQNELIERILSIMEDTSIIFDCEFSLSKLTVLLQSNYASVSQLINCAFNKNFRLLLNGYRIKEAQKLLSSPEAEKYTIESVANQVGFKSPNAFRQAFTNITGLSPSFYLKSVQEKRAQD